MTGTNPFDEAQSLTGLTGPMDETTSIRHEEDA